MKGNGSETCTVEDVKLLDVGSDQNDSVYMGQRMLNMEVPGRRRRRRRR